MLGPTAEGEEAPLSPTVPTLRGQMRSHNDTQDDDEGIPCSEAALASSDSMGPSLPPVSKAPEPAEHDFIAGRGCEEGATAELKEFSCMDCEEGERS